MEASVARIIDVNCNRCREALRVMEEYARFVQNDPAGTEAVKRVRHELACCIGRLPAQELLAARDTPGDVGTAISTEPEMHRADAAEVFVAAAKRLPEALRTIEEYAKTFDPDLAAHIEELRYRAYDLEQRISLRGSLAARFARVRLYVLITESLCYGDWLETARQAIAGGADCVQLREKGMDGGELLRRARLLAEVCHESGVLFIVNDRPDLAVLSGADGVHVGQSDLAPADARRIVGPQRLVGISTHNPEQFHAARDSGADYIAVGPMFDSPTKPQDHVPGPALLSLAQAETDIPIVPIGGITPQTLPAMREAGARRVCVCAAVIGLADVRAAAQQLRI